MFSHIEEYYWQQYLNSTPDSPMDAYLYFRWCQYYDLRS